MRLMNEKKRNGFGSIDFSTPRFVIVVIVVIVVRAAASRVGCVTLGAMLVEPEEPENERRRATTRTPTGGG